MFSLLLVFSAVLVSLIADVLFKTHPGKMNLPFFVGMVLFALSAIPTTFAYKSGMSFSRLGLTFTLMAVSTCLGLAVFWFQEPFTWRILTAAILIITASLLIA